MTLSDCEWLSKIFNDTKRRAVSATAELLVFVSNTKWLFGNFTTADFRQIWPRDVNRGWNADILWTEIYEKFPFRGHLPPKPQTWRGSNRHLTQSRIQVKGCTAERYCLLRVVVQGPGSFRGLVNFFVQRTIAELRGINFAQFSDFGLFSPYKTPKNVPSGDQPTQPTSYIAEWFRFFSMWYSKVQRGASRQRSFPATDGRGAVDSQTCPNFCLWQNFRLW